MSLDKLVLLRHDIKKCTRCSLCKLVPMPTIQNAQFTSACPPVDEYHFHAFSGGGMQVMALSLIDGRIEADQDLAHVVSACTTCGLCDVSCKFIMEVERMPAIMALKEHIVEAGFAPAAPQDQRDDFRQCGYATGEPVSSPGQWADGLEIKMLPGQQAEVLLYSGAASCFDARQAGVARKMALLMQHAGVDFGILGDAEPDPGLEAYWTGHREPFRKQADDVTGLLDQAKVKTIVVLSGSLFGLLRAKYPLTGRSPQARLLHASEFLQQLIDNGRLPLPNPFHKRVTYHDPCYLGRQSEPPQDWQGEEKGTHGVMTYFVPPKPINYGVNGIFDPPRETLRSIRGLTLVEMDRIREYAYCCGGGGGVPQAHPGVARSAARQRLDEAQATGAEVIVTACHHCRHNLIRWADDQGLPVLDLVDIVYEAAGLNQQAHQPPPLADEIRGF